MPLRDHDARWAIGLDLLFVDAARQHVALIRRQQEGVLALLGEQLRWGEPAASGLLRALREELGLESTTWGLLWAGLRSWRLGGPFGLDQPARDPRFLAAPSLAARAQVLSLVYLVEADLPLLVQAARPGPCPAATPTRSRSCELCSAVRCYAVMRAEQMRKETVMHPVGWDGPSGPVRPPQRGRSTDIIDAENAGELARLMQQDRLLTEAMGASCPRRALGCPKRAECWTWPVDRAAGP
ncbi:hypothetical protein [Thermogemmatispora sp.]|uniref:hypothetical protein n=1 Tax=Thermogemmatispora sp. TaxID=1968838 RepID=UPI0035E439CB